MRKPKRHSAKFAFAPTSELKRKKRASHALTKRNLRKVTKDLPGQLGNTHGGAPGSGRPVDPAVALLGADIDRALAKNAELLPLDALLSIMRERCPRGVSADVRRVWRQQQLDAAKAAAPYCHPKLSANVNAHDPTAPPEEDLNIRVTFVDAPNAAQPVPTEEQAKAKRK